MKAQYTKCIFFNTFQYKRKCVFATTIKLLSCYQFVMNVLLTFVKKETFSQRIKESNKMNTIESKKDICRICLEESVGLDWNTTMLQYYDMTYKDCYYKYTQLEYPDTDPFPQMLCHSCCNALISTHTLILKALESQQLIEKYNLQIKHEADNLTMNTSTDHNRLGDIKYATEFETVLVKKFEVNADYFEYNNPDEEIPTKPVEQVKESVVLEKPIRTKTRGTKSKTVVKVDEPLEEHPNLLIEMRTSKRKRAVRAKKSKTVAIAVNDTKSITTESENSKEENQEQCNYTETDSRDDIKNVEPKDKMKDKEKKVPGICSICSRVIHSKYAVKRHEQTHFQNRERKETCTVCGLKLYNKTNLYSHMQTHKENRERRHKCEFCDKAFYEKGPLNIHRRIHLGQMIPCTLCPKQYYRQIDLERHMSSHSATAINTEAKKIARYVVRCEHCDKSVVSTNFKSHMAAHLNEPLAKCTLCNKEYFVRSSCVKHIKRVHKKTIEECSDFIVIYNNNRMSHLLLEQKAEVRSKSE